MQFWALLALALGVAMDATAVAAARGLAARVVRVGDALLVAGLFGGAQALMPLLGWLVGARLGRVIGAWDHWVAFVVLAGIGLHMLWEARPGRPPPAAVVTPGAFALPALLALALATSLDAFAAGITLPLLEVSLPAALVTIGVTTALLSGAAALLAPRLGARFGRRVEAVGGLILMGVATKILIDHLRAG